MASLFKESEFPLLSLYVRTLQDAAKDEGSILAFMRVTENHLQNVEYLK